MAEGDERDWRKASPEERFAEAERRIAASAKANAQELDLVGLGLKTLPPSIAELTQLTSLSLSGIDIGPEGAKHLAGLTHLTNLNLGYNDIGPEGAKHLAGLTQLTSLDLNDNDIGPEGAKHLAGLTQLTELVLAHDTILSNNPIGSDGAKHLAGLTQLTRLDLRGNRIGPAGARHLAGLTQLTSLNLEGNEIGPEGAKHLAGLTKLTELNLGGNRIGPNGAAHLAGLTQLNSLDLSGNMFDNRARGELLGRIGPEGLAHLAGLSKLTCLSVSANEIGPDGVGLLTGLQNLTSLDLSWNEIGDGGIAHLALLTMLTRLNLAGNNIGPEGVTHLVRLIQLKILDLSHNDIGPGGSFFISGLRRLEALDLSHTGSIELQPLMDIAGLRSLILDGNRFPSTFADVWRMPQLEFVRMGGCVLGNVPPEILNLHSNLHTNCLPRLRAYFDDLDKGPAKKLRDVKVMILGNGQIGKTQFRRRLMNEPYDPSESSTHGVRIAETDLPARDGGEATPLKIWDFGGQDIYLGTHALFMRTRAVFPILWTPSAEAAKSHEAAGHLSKNYPLEEWVRYVATLAGTDSPAMILQTQCDKANQAAPAPVSRDLRGAFDYPLKDHAFSAKTGFGLKAAEGDLQDAIEWLIENRRKTVIGPGWAAVKGAIEAMQGADRSKPQAERQHRTMAIAAFNALCTEKGIADPAHAPILLQFLHNLGTLLFDERTFGDRIILDQQWALDAIYSVFDREHGALNKIKARKGRFTRSDLGYWVWNVQGFTEQDQDGFLALMLACAICFPLRAETEGAGETLYIAPDLLPERELVPRLLDGLWIEGVPQAEARVSYDVLPPGLLRTLMANIGREAGQAGTYWQEGFSFFDQQTQARAAIETERPDAHGWAGTIRIRTQHGQKEQLLRRLCDVVLEESGRFGLKPTVTGQDGARAAVMDDLGPMDGPDDPRGPVVARANNAADSAPRGPAVLLKPGPEPLTKPGCFISYKRAKEGDLSIESIEKRTCFDALTLRLESLNMTPLFDKTEMPYGESITKFMARMARTPRVALVISQGYVHSFYCMYELLTVFKRCEEDPDIFRDRIRTVMLADAAPLHRDYWVPVIAHWKSELERLNRLQDQFTRLNTEVPDDFTIERNTAIAMAGYGSKVLSLATRTLSARSVDDIALLTFG